MRGPFNEGLFVSYSQLPDCIESDRRYTLIQGAREEKTRLSDKAIACSVSLSIFSDNDCIDKILNIDKIRDLEATFHTCKFFYFPAVTTSAGHLRAA